MPQGELLYCSYPAGCHCIPVSCWELGCLWQVLFCWELGCPDGTPCTLCSALLGSVLLHILLACGMSHTGSALLRAVVWELALCVSCRESVDASCFTGSRCMLWGPAPLELGSVHLTIPLAVGASAGSWSMPHQPCLAGSQPVTCWPCHIVPSSPCQAVTQSPIPSLAFSHPAHSSQDKDQGHPAACSAEGPCLQQALGCRSTVIILINVF